MKKKIKQFGSEFKPLDIGIGISDKQLKNQIYIDDLIKLKEIKTTIPNFTPKKFIDQIQFVSTGGSYYLYIYLDNNWKSVAIT